MKNLKTFSMFLWIFLPISLFSQEIVYKPQNPAFGGDTFNYQWLLSSAEAQNSYKEKSAFSSGQQSDIDSFTESLNRQLLNKITSDLFREQFGSGELTEGTYMFGSLVLEISPTSDGLLINILDTQTGDQTQIIIPN
jgi:curli production assembly/transport component CsgF